MVGVFSSSSVSGGGSGGAAVVGRSVLLNLGQPREGRTLEVETSLLDRFQVAGGSVSSGGDSAAGRLEKESAAVGGRRC